MNIYYLDEPLGDDDLEFAKSYIAENIGLKDIQLLEQVRVPMILPPRADVGSSGMGLKREIDLLKNNLRRAGVMTWSSFFVHPS